MVDFSDPIRVRRAPQLVAAVCRFFMRPIRFHTTFLQELVFLTLGVVRRALRLKQPDQHVMASPRNLPIWQLLSKRGNPAARAPQVQSSPNTPIMKCLYPAKSLIL